MSRRGCFLCLSAVLAAGAAWAQSESFQASLTPDHAIHDRTTRIEGMTLSIWGENPQSAFSLGFVNGATGQSSGLSLGLLNYADTYSGAQWSIINITHGDVSGWQGGFAFGLLGSVMNYTGGHMRGLQTGLINMSGNLSGLQVGLVNYSQRVDSGLQIGLINLIAETEGWFENFPHEVAPGMVLANWRF